MTFKSVYLIIELLITCILDEHKFSIHYFNNDSQLALIFIFFLLTEN